MAVLFPDVAKPVPVVAHNTEVAAPSGLYQRRFKRPLDVALVVFTAPLTLTLVAIMCLLTILDGHNPFYSQIRIGHGGRLFRIWKMRTMVCNSESRLAELLASDPKARAEWDSLQKLKRDPRITLVGSILRKTSLDELPQLWNVLRGDMSLVGPRPILTCQQSLYPGQAYYAMRPGITGLWQVKMRNGSAFQQRARFDTDYANRLTFWQDLVIIFRTFGIVARGTGY